MVQGHRFNTVIVLFPDHFKKTKQPFATTQRDFETVFGLVATHQTATSFLLQHEELIEDSDLFEEDHGICAVLPFIKRFLPSAEVVPIAISISSKREEWGQLIAILSSIINIRTLIVQSTDFSHYLPESAAIQRDQETLNVIASGDLTGVARLLQPQHLDSRGAQYIQMRLQSEIFQARPAVIINSNSQAHSDEREARTTSYIVQLYDHSMTNKVGTDEPGSKVYCFAGDTLFGRRVLAALEQGDKHGARIRKQAQDILNGCRLILNLEGVVVTQLPTNLNETKLAMPVKVVEPWLRALNVVAVGVANNHAKDLGAAAFEGMVRLLREAGLAVLQHGVIVDLQAFRVVALTDLDNHVGARFGMITREELARLGAVDGRPPLFAFMHWGTEYSPTPSPRESTLLDQLRGAAVSLVVGAHPHVASKQLDLIAGGQMLSAFSLGNFLFDPGQAHLDYPVKTWTR
jgi:poly-gamma-glutamate synthesis protein (capsule biosynthesis protein)